VFAVDRRLIVILMSCDEPPSCTRTAAYHLSFHFHRITT